MIKGLHCQPVLFVELWTIQKISGQEHIQPTAEFCDKKEYLCQLLDCDRKRTCHFLYFVMSNVWHVQYRLSSLTHWTWGTCFHIMTNNHRWWVTPQDIYVMIMWLQARLTLLLSATPVHVQLYQKITRQSLILCQGLLERNLILSRWTVIVNMWHVHSKG